MNALDEAVANHPEAQRELQVLRDELERANDALDSIAKWTEAYPVEMFPEPDMARATKALADAGIEIGAVSGKAMRHVVSGVARIISSTRGLQ